MTKKRKGDASSKSKGENEKEIHGHMDSRFGLRMNVDAWKKGAQDQSE